MARSVLAAGGIRGFGHATAVTLRAAGDHDVRPRRTSEPPTGLVDAGRRLERGITVDVVAPGRTATATANAAGEGCPAGSNAQILPGRLAEPAEIAAAVRSLTNQDASRIAGAVVPVDGGAGVAH